VTGDNPPEQGTEDSIDRQHTRAHAHTRTHTHKPHLVLVRRCMQQLPRPQGGPDPRPRRSSVEESANMERRETKELVPRGAVPAMVFTGTQKGFCRVFPWPRRGEDNIKISINARRKKKPLTFTSRLEWGVLPFNTICFWALYMFHFQNIYLCERYTWI
jgi:hypothetical protein